MLQFGDYHFKIKISTAAAIYNRATTPKTIFPAFIIAQLL